MQEHLSLTYLMNNQTVKLFNNWYLKTKLI